MWRLAHPSSEDLVELRIVDESLASALFRGIPAARLLARVRLAIEASNEPRSRESRWRESIDSFLANGSRDHEQVTRAVARHARVAPDEGPLSADDVTLAVLVWAVACDTDEPGRDASLAEIAPRGGRLLACQPETLSACALHDRRLAHAHLDKRSPAFEACVRLSTRAALDAVHWERLQAVAAHFERAELGVRLFAPTEVSIFPRCIEDEVELADRRLAVLDRKPLDSLVATDPRRLASAIWRTERTVGSTTTDLASFLAELTRLLAHEGTLVAALSMADPAAAERTAATRKVKSPSSPPFDWTESTAVTLSDSLERGLVTPAQVQAAVSRGGEVALDAIGAEMLNVGAHPFASAACAEILARSGRPRDVVRLVTYFAVAPDPEPAARALGACAAAEVPRMLGAWMQTLLPQDEAAPDSGVARVSACLASLRPYPRLYQMVSGLLPRSATLC